MKLYVKNMGSLRCKMIVKNEIEKLGLTCVYVDLGMAEVRGDVSKKQMGILDINLNKSGLELIDEKKEKLFKKIKNLIIEMIYNYEEVPDVNDSEYISEKLNNDYTYLSGIFLEVEGVTIRQYIILHKIERVKDLLLNSDLTFTEIAHKLRYSSVADLSNQFKKVTGLTPTYFKDMKEVRESNPEDLRSAERNEAELRRDRMDRKDRMDSFQSFDFHGS